ncbi:GIY-YIG nuclease family protein [Lysobacter sp.]|uniref:GIY-YIG nuclease family protein n=1 Tax=Lysobacter sp. TaxID=72226 RepID=UPI002D6000F5|nr:GIY-YIG nuclease family protein [Lysobacter sp.]HZX79215.1 GIY-YIG nuclease family protein [Lysobacter sp.]
MKKLIVPQHVVAEPPHITRLKEVARWRLPEENSDEWVAFRLRSAAAMANPAYRKKLNAMAREANATARAIAGNGAGLPGDAAIREFLTEYNGRTAKFGLHYLPTSYNILHAFADYIPRLAVFAPLEERNHICNVSGFLDFISSNPEETPTRYSPRIDPGIVHCYSFFETSGEWTFESDGATFTVVAVNMVRHGSEITVMCQMGREADLADESESVRALMATMRPNPRKPNIEPAPDLATEAVALAGTSKLWRRYVAFRYDLRHQRLQARYSIIDMGSAWRIMSDDPLTLDSVKELGGEVDSQISAIEKDQGVFTFLMRFLRLPEYFLSASDRVVRDKAITSLSECSSSLKGRWLQAALKSQVRYEREVLTFSANSSGVDGFVFPPLELKVEVEGFWETLPFGTYGEGPDGERVLGRTWVRRTLSKRESRMPGAVTSASKEVPFLGGGEEGSIYVLRSAAHQLDIFKIGLTRRSPTVRAAEVSRGTGVPDQFLIVQTWWVPDVVFAEKRIHSLLDEYRLRDAREFFRAEYSTIRAAIELVVAEMSGRPSSA